MNGNDDNYRTKIINIPLQYLKIKPKYHRENIQTSMKDLMYESENCEKTK
jgi:hypothetical protein